MIGCEEGGRLSETTVEGKMGEGEGVVSMIVLRRGLFIRLDWFAR